MKHKAKARPGISTVACITHGKKPTPAPPSTSSLVCTAANDSPTAWSGKVSLAIALLTAEQGAQPSWTKVVSVGPVPPGGATRFWFDAAATGSCPVGAGPCWLYGSVQQQQSGAGATAQPARADIAVPLEALKDLVSSDLLPPANVSASVTSTNATAAELTVTSSGAAALYVHLTTAAQGQFSESGFHLLAGETRQLRFSAWQEHGKLDGPAFTKSLHVHWLNSV